MKKNKNRDKTFASDAGGTRLPTEALKFGKQLGIDFTGLEPEAQEIWHQLERLSNSDPLEYQRFISQQLQAAKEEEEERKAAASKKAADEKKKNDEGGFFRPEACFGVQVPTKGGDGLKIREINPEKQVEKILYVNVCSSKIIEEPIDRSGKKVTDANLAVADGLQIPLVVGPVRKLDDTSNVVDVIVHPTIIALCYAQRYIRAQITDLALEWVKQETRIDMDKAAWRDVDSTNTIKYKGGLGDEKNIPVLFHVTADGEKVEPTSSSSIPGMNIPSGSNSGTESLGINPNNSHDERGLGASKKKTATLTTSSLLSTLHGQNQEEEPSITEFNLQIPSISLSNEEATQKPSQQKSSGKVIEEVPIKKSKFIIEEIGSQSSSQPASTTEDSPIAQSAPSSLSSSLPSKERETLDISSEGSKNPFLLTKVFNPSDGEKITSAIPPAKKKGVSFEDALKENFSKISSDKPSDSTARDPPKPSLSKKEEQDLEDLLRQCDDDFAGQDVASAYDPTSGVTNILADLAKAFGQSNAAGAIKDGLLDASMRGIIEDALSATSSAPSVPSVVPTSVAPPSIHVLNPHPDVIALTALKSSTGSYEIHIEGFRADFKASGITLDASAQVLKIQCALSSFEKCKDPTTTKKVTMEDENPSFTFTGEDEFIPFRSSIIRYTDETMGNRTEGRTKRKSVKANVTSKFSSKRKLSRMGKKVKKGKAGPSTEFITRSAALRKLQITLKDFRRLCILKGIYPRVPTKPLKGADKVYYDIKDISYIMNEPLLDRFRQFKAFMKKIRRAAGRNQFTEARRVNDLKPRMVLDHLVKERYPRFIDAVRDLDDCLCMIHLFAALPSVGRITADRTSVCSKLAREWQYFVSKSKALRKVFVSVKGIYYQAEIMGESVSWLVPHAFTQHLPSEVDFRVMLTFLEFYEIFFKFVLFKLYANQGWQYPPVVDERLDHAGSCLLAMKSNDLNAAQPAVESKEAQRQAKLEAEAGSSSAAANSSKSAVDAKQFKQQVNSLPKLLQSMPENEDDDDEDDGLDISAPLSAAFSDLQRRADEDADEAEREVFRRAEADSDSSDAKLTIFSRLTFFINREVPLTTLQMCTTAFGGRIGWDGPGSPFDASDASITHHVIDRPMQATPAQQQREFIQPQWVFDSINAGLLLPTRLYAPGNKLPPHLSPFVDDEKEGYLPRYREEVQKLQVAAGILDAVPTGTTTSSNDKKKKTQQQDDDDEEEDDSEDDDEEEDDSDDDEESSEEEDAEELMEVPSSKKVAPNGKNSKTPAAPAVEETKKGPKAIVQKAKVAKQSESEEVHELAVSMMSKKTKRLYDKMQYGINEKQESVKKLEAKRRLAEEDTAPASSKKQQPQSKKQRKA